MSRLVRYDGAGVDATPRRQERRGYTGAARHLTPPSAFRPAPRKLDQRYEWCAVRAR